MDFWKEWMARASLCSTAKTQSECDAEHYAYNKEKNDREAAQEWEREKATYRRRARRNMSKCIRRSYDSCWVASTEMTSYTKAYAARRAEGDKLLDELRSEGYNCKIGLVSLGGMGDLRSEYVVCHLGTPRVDAKRDTTDATA